MKDALIIVDIQDDVPAKQYEPLLQPISNLIQAGPDLVIAVRRVEGLLPTRVRRWANFVVTVEAPGAYSAFEGGTLRPLLSFEALLETYRVGGPVTFCGVIVPSRPMLVHTALDARALGYSTRVAKIATYVPEEVEETVADVFARAGIEYE